MLLGELVEQKHVLFCSGIKDWREAVEKSCEPLVQDGTVEPGYAQEIIRCIEKNGPYIVLIPGFAMPHSTEDSLLAHRSGISFMKLDKCVSFDANNKEKDAKVFFTLAAKDKNAHLDNMQKLFKMLSNEKLCARLLEVKNLQDLLALDHEFESAP